MFLFVATIFTWENEFLAYIKLYPGGGVLFQKWSRCVTCIFWKYSTSWTRLYMWDLSTTFQPKTVSFLGQNFQLQSALISELANRWEFSYIGVFSSSSTFRIYQSHTWTFLELDPPWRIFRVCMQRVLS